MEQLAGVQKEPKAKEVREMADLPADRWENRGEKMRCWTCMWFAPKGREGDLGRCRRRSPTMSGYPVVFENDWCGDHKLAEKILREPKERV